MFSIGDRVCLTYDDVKGSIIGIFHAVQGFTTELMYAVELDFPNTGYIANNRIFVSDIVVHHSNVREIR